MIDQISNILDQTPPLSENALQSAKRQKDPEELTKKFLKTKTDQMQLESLEDIEENQYSGMKNANQASKLMKNNKDYKRAKKSLKQSYRAAKEQLKK